MNNIYVVLWRICRQNQMAENLFFALYIVVSYLIMLLLLLLLYTRTCNMRIGIAAMMQTNRYNSNKTFHNNHCTVIVLKTLSQRGGGKKRIDIINKTRVQGYHLYVQQQQYNNIH